MSGDMYYMLYGSCHTFRSYATCVIWYRIDGMCYVIYGMWYVVCVRRYLVCVMCYVSCDRCCVIGVMRLMVYVI